MKINKEEFFDACLNNVPDMEFPQVGSILHKDDIATVKHYVDNHSFDDDFLEDTHRNVKKIFKKFCKKNDIKVNWKFLKSALNACYDFVHHLKQKHKRERPKFYLIQEDDFYKKIKNMKSYSFPSGHTASAYFVSGLLTSAYPDYQSEFEKLAYYIGQSRIENGVHYPTDVSYGRLVGEICSDIFLEDFAEESLLGENFRFKEKLLINSLRENKLLTQSASEIPDVIFSLFEGKIPISEINTASNQFFQGYPIKKINCNPFIKSFFRCLVESYHYKKEKKSFKKFVNVHKVILDSCFLNSKQGSIRKSKNTLSNGISTCSVDNIYKFSKLISESNKPEVNFLLAKWVNPFEECNNIVATSIFLVENNFSFDKINDYLYRSFDDLLKNYLISKGLN